MRIGLKGRPNKAAAMFARLLASRRFAGRVQGLCHDHPQDDHVIFWRLSEQRRGLLAVDVFKGETPIRVDNTRYMSAFNTLCGLL